MNAVVKKWGNSQGIRLPKSLLSEAGFQIDDEIEVSFQKDAIILKKKNPTAEQPKETHLETLFAHWDGDYKPEEVDFGESAGREIW